MTWPTQSPSSVISITDEVRKSLTLPATYCQVYINRWLSVEPAELVLPDSERFVTNDEQRVRVLEVIWWLRTKDYVSIRLRDPENDTRVHSDRRGFSLRADPAHITIERPNVSHHQVRVDWAARDQWVNIRLDAPTSPQVLRPVLDMIK